MTPSLRLPFAALIFLCVISLVTPSAWSSATTLGQCPSCLTAQNIKLPASLKMTVADNQGSAAPSYLTDTPTNVPGGYDLHNVPYNAWCIDGFGLGVTVTEHTVTPISTLNLAPTWGTNWSKVNYLLNHKVGANYHDVQRDIWLLLGLTVDPSFPETPNSLAMLADANANGAGFVPSYGQVLGIVMQEDGLGGFYQDTMIEFRIPPCGAIGDFVWQDTNKDGIQNDGNAGINGVVVKLTDSTSASITTVTGNAPNGYSMLPGLPPNAPGYYQFTGLCAGTYTVSVDSNQTPLLNFTPTTVNAGSDTTIDSNLHSGAPVTLATDTAVDETIDFGYIPKAPITLTCAAATGQQNVFYSSSLIATGGTSPYTYSIIGGALPASLLLNTLTGAISGTPIVSGSFSYTAQVTDSNNQTYSAAGENCPLVINPPPTANCVVITAVQGVAITPVTMVGSGGAGAPYTFSATGLPAGITMSTGGTISGTPTVNGTFSYTVTIKDKAGNTGTLNCSVTVTTPVKLTCVTCTQSSSQVILASSSKLRANTSNPTCETCAGQVGVAYSGKLSATGGTGSYTFKVTSGMPPGLTLNASTGAITGTPTTAGTYSLVTVVTDSTGHSDTATCPIVVSAAPVQVGQFTTYTQGGWGAPAQGNNAGALLTAKFTTVYTGGSVSIGGTAKLTFTSALSIINFLPQSGTPRQLAASATNPTTSAAGAFAGEVLALQLNVGFSNKGITPAGLANLKAVSGPLAGQTVTQVLALANSVLGGAALPSGISTSDLNNAVNAINNNFDSGTTNQGYLQR